MLEARTRRLAPSTTLVAAALVAAACVGAQPSPGAGSRRDVGLVRAVVSLRDAAAQLPGVRVLLRLPRVAAAVVTGTPAGVRALAHDPAVLGISPDSPLRAQDEDGPSPAGPVRAPDALGGDAGRWSSGAGVTVALLDTGVSDTPALDRASHRLVDGVDTSRLQDGGAARTSGRFTDGYGHGTYMASIIAGGPLGGRGRGIGVAPGARVIVVKVADRSGRTSLSEVLAGLDWVATQAPRIQVAAVALARPRPGDAYGEDPLTVAVEHVQHAGVAVIAAAGNTPGEVGDPGLDPRVTTVGAADTRSGDPSVAPFSGYGDVAGVAKPDVVAAGVSVLGMLPRSSVVAREHPEAAEGRGLYRGSGTSPATAVATGVAANFLSHHPDATLDEVKPSLRAAAEGLDGVGAGTGLVQLADDAVAATPESTGEAGLDAQAFRDAAWRAGDWREQLDRAWSPLDPAASSWPASSWSASSWSASSWSASSWSASSWSASSWSASSWSASSWSASSWSASSWSASSWSASSWSASSWSSLWGRR